MSEIFVHDKQDQDKIKELFSAIDMEFDSDCDGFQVDGYIKFDEIIKVADYLRSLQEGPEHVGSEFNENWLKVGDMVTGYNQNGVFYGKVNHIDGRDVVIVMDYQCSMPFPPMLKPDLRGLEEPEQHRIEPLRIEEADTFDINQMRKEFKDLAAKWRNIAGDADISVNVWSHTRGNPIQRYDAAPIIIDICCDVSVKELEL